jgi:hypothetical protein
MQPARPLKARAALAGIMRFVRSIMIAVSEVGQKVGNNEMRVNRYIQLINLKSIPVLKRAEI